MEDRFKINWSENSRGYNTLSITGYSYQLDAWQSDFMKKYPKSKFETRVVTSIEHSNGLVTRTISRRINKT